MHPEATYIFWVAVIPQTRLYHGVVEPATNPLIIPKGGGGRENVAVSFRVVDSPFEFVKYLEQIKPPFFSPSPLI